MSEVIRHSSLAKQLATRWQVPLLIVSLALLAVGVWRLRPGPVPPTFEQLLSDVRALADSGLYPEASRYASELLAAPDRTAAERRRLYAELARIIFLHEQGNAVHGTGNCERIIINTNMSLGEGESFDGPTHRMRAMALEWLQKPAAALAEYQQAVEKGVPDAWEIRKRIIEIRRATQGMSAQELHDLFDQFMVGDGVSQELQFWAALQKVELFGREGNHAAAERFLSDHVARFRDSVFAGQFDYLQALSWYHLGRKDDAERLLRSVRNRLAASDPTYICAGWLLGRILQEQESPEFALSFYEDVLDKAPPGPYRTAAILGRAETLAALERFDESIESYSDAVQKTMDSPYGSLVNIQQIRESATGWYQNLLSRGRPAEAMLYLRQAARLVPPADTERQAGYAEWLADLAMKLGESLLVEEEASATAAGRVARAREYLQEAAREYLRLARLASLNEVRSSHAIWRAAEALDRAGDPRQAAEVLDRFVTDRPTNPRVPEALRRLGQMYQSVGDYDRAIARYQENMVKYSGTPAAVSSLVPLADCFIEKGDLEKAEQALLRLVGHKSEESLRSVMPEAREYREALFRLGDLYIRAGKYEEAIARFQEALDRYPNDPRSGRAMFMLAESHRISADRLYDDYGDPRNAPHKDRLRATYVERLNKARRLYDGLIERFRARDASTVGLLDRAYVKLSHFYRADVVHDLARVSDPSDLRPFVESLELYDRAAWLYQDDPLAMSAYIQMINCYIRLGKIDKARMTLQRARWALKGISDEAFTKYSPDEDREYWTAYLDWLEKTPTFSVVLAGTP
ncbi:MAG TPA: tetratricopeptide repeat protein [Phycisphaerae bacterium]|nr:tetratricopeptide repeat protein [Phycisphaerae bacterium]HRR84977.1 tetratricopeptide repeat protein [Phycisphaerae bacterium]